MLITIPNPATISFPLGTLAIGDTSFFSAELDTDEVVVKLDDVPPVADVIVVPWSTDWVGAIAVISCAITGSTGAIDLLITEFGFVGLIGLIGLTGLFIFVAVITHVSDVTDQAVHVGIPYGSEHCEVLDSVINPL